MSKDFGAANTIGNFSTGVGRGGKTLRRCQKKRCKAKFYGGTNAKYCVLHKGY